jgi:hypothetical protein
MHQLVHIKRAVLYLLIAFLLLSFKQQESEAADQSTSRPTPKNHAGINSENTVSSSQSGADSAFANAWYYLFSTIPQVFAAAYGIAFALVLYRLQQLDNAIEAIANSLADFANRVDMAIAYHEWCADMAVRHNWEGYLASLKKLCDTHNDQFVTEENREETCRHIGIHGEEIRRQLKLRKTIWTQLRRNLFLTMLLIGATASAIPLGHYVDDREFFIGWTVIIVFMLITLVLYFKLLIALVRPLGPTGS